MIGKFFGIVGCLIEGVIIIAIHLLVVDAINNAIGQTSIGVIIIAIIFCIHMLNMYVFKPIGYILKGRDSCISNPYRYGTPEYEAREIRNNLEELNRKL